MNLSEKEVRTCLAVFDELRKMPYSKLNTFLGSITIEEMNALDIKMAGWYHNQEKPKTVMKYKDVGEQLLIVIEKNGELMYAETYRSGEDYNNGELTMEDFLTNIEFYFDAEKVEVAQ